jgi:YD repeat-containing protein
VTRVSQRKGTPTPKRIGLAAVFIAFATVSFPSTAAAVPPTRVQVAVNDIQDLPSGSLCPFHLTFTGTGTITLTTYYDQAGNPTSQTVHGALTHTIFSAWHTLASNGPAAVHMDLATGEMVDTGKEFAFHVPGDGIVLGTAGRLVFAADGSVLSFAGNMVTDTSTLCAALGP